MTSPASAAAAPRVTVIGDSVQASFEFAPAASSRLGEDLDLRVDARVCRRLVAPSCSYRGDTPETALALARRLGPALGDVVVVNVGYNDELGGYGIDALLGTLRRAGVRAVVWVTLRESRGSFPPINAAIRAAARRSPLVRVADWNALSAGRPWFAADGLHLNATGALALAGLIREGVIAGLASIGVPVGGEPLTRSASEVRVGLPATRIAGEGRTLWIAGGDRLAAVDERTGRRLAPPAPLPEGDDLTSDGRQAWLRVGAESEIARPSVGAPALRGRVLGRFGGAPLLARAGSWLWIAAGASLEGVEPRSGRRQTVAGPPGPVRGLAASRRALWMLVSSPEAGARPGLELRDPRTGAVIRSVRLPGTAAPRAIAATERTAWVVTADGRLLEVTRGGGVRSVLARVRAVVADAREELWALRSDRRTVVQLDPASGRVRARARSRLRLSEAASRMALTRDHLWIAAAHPSTLVRVPRA